MKLTPPRLHRTTVPFLLAAALLATRAQGQVATTPAGRERISIDDDWRFTKGDPEGMKQDLSLLTVRAGRGRGGRGAPPAAPTTGPATGIDNPLWQYILPTGDDFINDPTKRFTRPDGNPVEGLTYAAANFDDSAWRKLDLPHDFGIEGPFVLPGTQGSPANGGTGRLPFYGQAWYRKHLDIPAADKGKQIYLDMDGAMAYAMVFCNGQLVGGWPYGYSSWRVDLTPYLKPGADNTLAIRLDNPPNSSRWYPGGGIYRNVWLTKTNPVRVAQWGTYLTTLVTSKQSATINLGINVENDSKEDADVSVSTAIYALDANGDMPGDAIANATIPAIGVRVPAGKSLSVETTGTVREPRLWSPKSPNRYVAYTTVKRGDRVLDHYETPFGIRTVKYDPNEGLSINGEHLKMNGVCDHHDLGALGSAINFRTLQRQLEILKDMGCNAIRTSHNPPTPELLDLADQMGFVVMDETFDTWRGTKTPNDYGRIFAQWHEQDTRMLIRRDRNHPSVIMWSIGNEIGEQGQGQAGGDVAAELARYVKEEDPTRPITSAMNAAAANSPYAKVMEAIGLNYRGSRLDNPLYETFHKTFPDRFIYGSETSSTISSRGEYTFPVAPTDDQATPRPRARGGPAPEGPEPGEDAASHQMSSYDMYHPEWATSPETEFAAQDRYPYLGGEFVWTGFDYLGEPTPWGGGNDPSRSSYFGIIDLAGFPKDRFYLYQAHWRPDFAMAHILPHWTWPDRVGQVTPVHVYTSGDEAELFLNGKSQGRKKKPEFQYRIRWDDVVYEPGELKVVAYKAGKEWASETVRTASDAAKLALKPDRATIAANGHDLSFVTLTVQDKDGIMAPRTKNLIHFTITGPGEIVATDNGDPTDLNIFSLPDRKAFNGLALAIIKAKRGSTDAITVTASGDGLTPATCTITTK